MSTPSFSTRRAPLGIIIALALMVAGCSDSGLFSPNRSAGTTLQIRPYFALQSGMGSMAADVNAIRLIVRQLPQDSIVLQKDTAVSPTETEWNLPLDVPPNSDLVILIELINRGATDQIVYSGTLSVHVTEGQQPAPPAIPLYPGPPDNLTVQSVTIAPRDQNVLEGDNVQLHASAQGPGNPTFLWESSSAAVATVDANGLVTAKAPGQATITAKSGAQQDNITVTVGARVTRIELNPASSTLTSLGATATFTGRVLDVRNAVVPGQTISWAIADSTIASQTSAGVFKALKNGTTTITASTTQAGRVTTATASLKVEQHATVVTVAPAALSFDALGATQTLTAQAKDANGNAVSGVTFTWTSSDNNVATVDANGVVTAKGNGTAKIKAESSGSSAEVNVSVQQAPSTMVVTPTSATLRSINETVQLSAVVKDARGNVMSTPVSWTSSLPGIADVDGNGLVTARGDGQVVITAIAGTLRSYVAINVSRVAATVQVTPAHVDLHAGAHTQLNATPVDANGFGIEGLTVTWASNHPNIVSVNSTGLIGGISAGDAEVTAKAGNAFGTATVTVTGTVTTSVSIVPARVDGVGNCIPFGDNVTYWGSGASMSDKFEGFIYRNVPAFSINAGDKIAFDLGRMNDVAVRRNIFFAAANKNPAADPSGLTHQGVHAVAWTKVVSEANSPDAANPRGNTIAGDYELVYTAEAPFTFAGGGFIIGFSGNPPATYVDQGCDQVLVSTSYNDPSGFFYARFYDEPDQSLGDLDDHGGGNASSLGGFKIYAAGTTSQIISQPTARMNGFQSMLPLLNPAQPTAGSPNWPLIQFGKPAEQSTVKPNAKKSPVTEARK